MWCVTWRNIQNAEKDLFKLREAVISFQYVSDQQEGDKKLKTALLSDEVLRGLGVGV